MAQETMGQPRPSLTSLTIVGIWALPHSPASFFTQDPDLPGTWEAEAGGFLSLRPAWSKKEEEKEKRYPAHFFLLFSFFLLPLSSSSSFKLGVCYVLQASLEPSIVLLQL